MRKTKSAAIQPGNKMTKGRGWRLRTTLGREREFAATLIDTINIGSTRLAIFKVPKR